MHWIWLIIVGAVVGALGRLFHPGVDPMGWLLTILIGIASLVIAGVIFSNGVVEFIVGIIVAVILVALVGRFYGGRRAIAREPRQVRTSGARGRSGTDARP
jgi:uncharacterized membrane protein YeaQ/YmgE (transglycosylase-associated protein family)